LSANRKRHLINKNKKGTQLCYNLIDFKKVITTQTCQLKFNTQRVSLKRFIDGYEHNNGG